ncbi:MAG: hypothetical protein ABF709_04920 [Leuconostoc pseudomesenteroides]|uniref:hypothetical protein n=1 Tax=Leuconostoc pseudomesenteroides TaxID=33968 RepID=UPI001E283DEF|nr:hypothetical protein [Leuconostoc pseudomesenteroides]MCC7668940.1 hypothetical protein [Leuconostoc pseudomesenteroides]
MLEFDFEMDTHVLEQKIQRLTNISSSEMQQKVTKPAAEVIKKQINQDLYSVAKTHSVGGLKENLVLVTDGKNNGSTAVGYTKSGHYYRFVDEGHFVMDNRRGRLIINVNGKKKTIRNYRYKLKVLNSGGKFFGGYHFVESGRRKAKPEAMRILKKGFLSLVREKS